MTIEEEMCRKLDKNNRWFPQVCNAIAGISVLGGVGALGATIGNATPAAASELIQDGIGNAACVFITAAVGVTALQFSMDGELYIKICAIIFG